LADTHGIAKYARTYIQRYTHKHTLQKKVIKVEKKKTGKERTKNWGSGKRERREKKMDKKQKRGKKRGKRKKRGGRKKFRGVKEHKY